MKTDSKLLLIALLSLGKVATAGDCYSYPVSDCPKTVVYEGNPNMWYKAKCAVTNSSPLIGKQCGFITNVPTASPGAAAPEAENSQREIVWAPPGAIKKANAGGFLKKLGQLKRQNFSQTEVAAINKQASKLGLPAFVTTSKDGTATQADIQAYVKKNENRLH